MVRISETVFVVARPDGSSDRFDTYQEADAVRAGTPGSQLRTVQSERDVPADYVVTSGGDEVSRHTNAADAGRVARSTPGSVVVLLPREE